MNPTLTWPIGEVAGSTTAKAELAQNRVEHSFDSVYRTWFADVARWVRARGANAADVEDLTQEVFIIVRRKLGEFDGRNLAGFLYRITERTVRDHRRSTWVRSLFRNPSPLPEIVETRADSLETIQQRERRKALDGLLAKMTEKRRTTFVLFEIEGYSGEEIAQIQSLPLDTVWTRLHHARKDFMRLVAGLPSARSDE